jgi:hypothetical protein
MPPNGSGRGSRPQPEQERFFGESGGSDFDSSVETCRDVILTVLREAGIEEELPYYAMYMIDSDGEEREMRWDERPREILEGWHAAGIHATLTVRRSYEDTGSEHSSPNGTSPE